MKLRALFFMLAAAALSAHAYAADAAQLRAGTLAPFSGGLAAVRVGDNWGYIDASGKLAIQPAYREAGEFSDGLAAARFKGKFGFIDQKGNCVVQPRFINAGKFSQGLAPVQDKTGKWGYVGRDGEYAIKPAFDEAASFSGGLAAVRDGAQWGYIGKDGDYEIKPAYAAAGAFGDGLAPVRISSGDEWGFINEKGASAISPRYEDAKAFSGGLAAVMMDGQWGYIDADGKIVVSPQFESAGNFAEKLAPVAKDGKWGYIDAKGAFAIPPQYAAAQHFSDGLALVSTVRESHYVAASGAQNADLPATLHSDRDECLGVRDCVSATTKQPLAIEPGKSLMVTLRCPASHPYFWDWGYEGDAKLDFLLVSTLNTPDKGPGGIRVEVSAGNGGADMQYQLFTACSSTPMTHADLTRILDAGDSLPAQDVPKAVVKAGVDELPAPNVGSVGELSDVGNRILSELTKNDTDKKFRGKTWNVSTTNRFESDFMLQSPDITHWGKHADELPFLSDDACPQGTCNKLFRLTECTTEDDCKLLKDSHCREAAALSTSSETVKLCMRPQDVLWDDIYKTMIKADRLVDITTLNQNSQAPDGRFMQAIRAGIKTLGASGKEVTVRILIGQLDSQMHGKPGVLLDKILKDVKDNPNCKLNVQLGYYEASPDHYKDLLWMSMNHSKTVVADGKFALVGGENMYDDDYLSMHPAHDMTLRVEGPAAYDAHAFDSYLWQWVDDNRGKGSHEKDVYAWTWKHGDKKYDEKGALDTSVLPDSYRKYSPGNTTVFGVGRVGDWYFMDPTPSIANASDLATLAMFNSAKSAIRIAQQDAIWGPAAAVDRNYDDWPEWYPEFWYPVPYITDIANAMLSRGVSVYVVVSSFNSKTGKTRAGSYYNGFTAKPVAEMFRWALSRNDLWKNLDDKARKELLCKKLHVATVRFGPDADWGDDKRTPFANHSKTVIVDDKAFYVGSHNFYPMNLQEYGLIVDDKDLTTKYLNDYWQHLWENSKAAGVCGDDVKTCIFN
jgi:phosphatidylserine/phosphatidylglycerophosphate/cardiolipin synthase-like enzyme